MSSASPTPRGWSWKIAAPFGIEVRIHATFLLLLAWIFVSTALRESNPWTVFRAVATVVTLFAIVVLHELGHALVARHYGIRTSDITLFPIGGVARLERIPDVPVQELAVAFAGPAVNLVLAVLFAVLAMALQVPFTPDAAGFAQTSWVTQMLWANVTLAVFNLIPAFPMDGGRVVRALLAIRLGPDRATSVAAGLGQAIAVIFGFIGLFSSPILVLIAVFVWVGAASEARVSHIRAAIRGVRVADVMIRRFATLSPQDSLGRVVELAIHGFQHEFPVVGGDGYPIGSVAQRDLLLGLSEHGLQGVVGQVMQSEVCIARPSELLSDVFMRMQTGSGCRMVTVVDGGTVVGLITFETIGEVVTIEDALTARRAHSQHTQPAQLTIRSSRA